MMTALWVSLGLVVLLVLAALIGALIQVENWSRDFTTNSAATDESSPDPRQRPIESARPPAELAEVVVAAATKLPRWNLNERIDSDNQVELHFIRSTALWRFKDDIRVRLEPTDTGGSRLTAESRSRVGKGDLGQNPRNLRELLEAVRQAAP
jgi:uncharacterized protein (DUF1499 family)